MTSRLAAQTGWHACKTSREPARHRTPQGRSCRTETAELLRRFSQTGNCRDVYITAVLKRGPCMSLVSISPSCLLPGSYQDSRVQPEGASSPSPLWLHTDLHLWRPALPTSSSEVGPARWSSSTSGIPRRPQRRTRPISHLVSGSGTTLVAASISEPPFLHRSRRVYQLGGLWLGHIQVSDLGIGIQPYVGCRGAGSVL